MGRWTFRIAGGVAALALALLALYGYAWWYSERALAQRYEINDAPLKIPAAADAIAHGGHLYATRGCADCHGERGEGSVVFDLPPLRVVAPNLTPSRLVARGYDADRVAAAIRHGVRADGTPLVFMPSRDWMELGDEDTAALVAYLRTLPDSDNEPGALEIRPLARVLHLLGRFPLLPAESIDHRPRLRTTPPAAANIEYGRYVAASCVGCHGEHFAGGPPLAPGTPAVANLTPAGALATWSEADFARAMRSGQRPDGRRLDPFMPYKAFATMTDTEISALFAFLRSVPARPPGG